MRRETIARGIYRDPHGFTVRWRDGGVPRERRFPIDTPPDVLKRFRSTQRGQARRPEGGGGAGRRSAFHRAIARYLRTLRGRPGYDGMRNHCKPWIPHFTGHSPYTITRREVLAIIATWTRKYTPGEIKQRVTALRGVILTANPDEIPAACYRVVPKQRPPNPRKVADETIANVVRRLHARERSHGLTSKHRARLLVLAATGRRPIQLSRAKPEHVDLAARIWYVQPAKGGREQAFPLNDEMIAAFTFFATADAWGPYCQQAFRVILRRYGWPAGVRPYTLRHSVGILLSEAGVDLGDIQAVLNHASPDMTRVYVPTLDPRVVRAVKAIEGRFPADLFQPAIRVVKGGRI